MGITHAMQKLTAKKLSLETITGLPLTIGFSAPSIRPLRHHPRYRPSLTSTHLFKYTPKSVK
jgi:hypothetical protein